MSKESAIAALVKSGMTIQEAQQEFNAMVNWYLRGTGRTAADIAYATKCAINDLTEEV